MTPPLQKVKRAIDYHYFRLKNNWIFPSNMAHKTGANIAKGTHETDVTTIVKNYLRKGSDFVDVGANVGYYSRLASQIVGSSGRVYAFEVEHDNFYALSKNTDSLTNVIPMNFAVTNENSFLKINHSSHSACHSIVDNDHHLDGNHFITPTITLDKFWSVYLNQSKIDLIKIDVEGAELFVLEGMENIMSGDNVKAIIIEYCPQLLLNAGRETNKFFKWLNRYFQISIIEKRFKNLQSHDIISTRKEFGRITNYLLNMDGAVNVNLLCRSKVFN